MKAISGDCLANTAIRLCFVDTLSEFRCIRCVSQIRFHESTSRFPPLAPTGCCSPTSSVQSRRYDALLPSRRTSFPSLGGTSVALVSFAPWRTSAPPRPGVGKPVSPPVIRRGANRVLPRSWGTLDIRLHMFQSDSGGTAYVRPFRHSSVAPGMKKAKAPTMELSELNSMAFVFAVYASWSELPQYHAKLASSCWSGSAARDSHPQGSGERFQRC